MGRKSVQGAIQARLEGGAGGFAPISLIESPQEALEDIVKRAGFRAAGRAKMIDKALFELAEEQCDLLLAVYWAPPQVGLEAWDSLANLVAFSPLAHRKYRQSRVKMSFGEWVTRLSCRKIGVLGRDKLRAAPKATPKEVSLVNRIEEECRNMLQHALQDYVDAYKLVGVGSLVQRVLRKSGRRSG